MGLLLPADNPSLDKQVEAAIRRFGATQVWVELEVVRARVNLNNSFASARVACSTLVGAGVSGLIVLHPGSSLPLLQSLGRE